MAISWGAWEYSGGNGMRVGIEADWENVTNGESVATCTVKYYTENQYGYSDGQTLKQSGAIDGSVSFTNNDGGAQILRSTKTYDFTYGAASYGSSPGTRTFSASISGAYNGVTPSKSLTVDIPARPYAAPNAPGSVSMARVSDTATLVSWVNNSTTGKPYETVTVQKSIGGGAYATVASPSGSASSYTAPTAANQRLRFQVRANNDAGSSSYVASSSFIWTAPIEPTAPSRADIGGPGQRITWTNAGIGYTEYVTEVIGYKNGVSVGVIGTAATGAVTFDHLTTTPTNPYTTGDRWKYTVRHKTSSGTALYSAETAFTTESSGVTSPPNPPTGLDPNGGVIDPTVVNALTWTFNPTDTSDQQVFQIRRRLAGGGWTTETAVTSSTKSWNLPANTYANGNAIEWQVRTRGAATTGGPAGDGYSDWSATATMTGYITKLVVPRWNVGTAEMAVDVSGHDWVDIGVGGAPAFQNSWVNYGAPFTGARYCRRGGIVYLEGLVKLGTINTTIFTLPAGFRPDNQLVISAITSTFNTGAASAGTAHTHPITQQGGRIDIKTNGDVVQVGAATNAWQSIHASFPADL